METIKRKSNLKNSRLKLKNGICNESLTKMILNKPNDINKYSFSEIKNVKPYEISGDYYNEVLKEVEFLEKNSIEALPYSEPSQSEQSSSLRIIFKIEKGTQFGETVHMTGSSDELGKWANFKQMDFTKGTNSWSLELRTSEKSFEYKFILLNTRKECIWEEIPNRKFDMEKLIQNIQDLKIPKGGIDSTFFSDGKKYDYHKLENKVIINHEWNL